MLYERRLALTFVLFLFAALPFASTAQVSVERQYWSQSYQIAAKQKRQRVKARRQQLGKPPVLAYRPQDLRAQLSRVPESLRARIAYIERTWGQVEIVSVCRPGATFVQNGKRFPSWHGQCRAVDFEPPAKHRRTVLAYLRKTIPGYVLTYSWSKHIHIDNAREGSRVVNRKVKQWPIARIAVSDAKPKPKALPKPPLALAGYQADYLDADFKLVSLPPPIPAIIREQDKRQIFELDEARRYLVATAVPGGTMTRQGPSLAIERLHPQFTVRLAGLVKQARREGIMASIFSAYRPPAFGVGGFRDKAQSLHAYGLAVDFAGIGPAGSKQARRFYQIALAHKVYNPYGPSNRAEFNHFQPLWTKGIARHEPLRKMITAKGPIDLPRMWQVANRLIDTGARQTVRIAKRGTKTVSKWTKRKWANIKKRWIKKRRHHV